MTPREFLLALVVLSSLCAIIGAVQLISAVWRFSHRDLVTAFAPLETKLTQTMTALEATAKRIDTLDALATRAERAAEIIVASRAGMWRAGIALGASFQTLRAEWRRIRRAPG